MRARRPPSPPLPSTLDPYSNPNPNPTPDRDPDPDPDPNLSPSPNLAGDGASARVRPGCSQGGAARHRRRHAPAASHGCLGLRRAALRSWCLTHGAAREGGRRPEDPPSPVPHAAGAARAPVEVRTKYACGKYSSTRRGTHHHPACTPSCTPACPTRSGSRTARPAAPPSQVQPRPPAHCALPARYFYDSLVACAADGPVSRPPKGFAWPGGMPLCFVDCGRDLEMSHGLTGGRSNPAEAALVARIVSGVLAAGTSPSKVAVLAPYARQVVRELPIQPAPCCQTPLAAVQPRLQAVI